MHAWPGLQSIVAFGPFGHDPFNQISENFGVTRNGLVQSNRSSFENLAHLLRWTAFLGWTDPTGMDRPTHSQSQDLAVRYFSCTKQYIGKCTGGQDVVCDLHT